MNQFDRRPAAKLDLRMCAVLWRSHSPLPGRRSQAEINGKLQAFAKERPELYKAVVAKIAEVRVFVYASTECGCAGGVACALLRSDRRPLTAECAWCHCTGRQAEDRRDDLGGEGPEGVQVHGGGHPCPRDDAACVQVGPAHAGAVRPRGRAECGRQGVDP